VSDLISQKMWRVAALVAACTAGSVAIQFSDLLVVRRARGRDPCCWGLLGRRPSRCPTWAA